MTYVRARGHDGVSPPAVTQLPGGLRGGSPSVQDRVSPQGDSPGLVARQSDRSLFHVLVRHAERTSLPRRITRLFLWCFGFTAPLGCGGVRRGGGGVPLCSRPIRWNGNISGSSSISDSRPSGVSGMLADGCGLWPTGAGGRRSNRSIN